MVDPCYRKNCTVGSLVSILDEEDDFGSIKVTGKIKEVLSLEVFSEDGTRVKLDNGKKGPVQAILRQAKGKNENEELLSGEENSNVEFKGSYTFDIHKFEQRGEKRRLYALECSAVKTMAGFANRDGGILFMGVDDKKDESGKRIIRGLEHDYEVMGVDVDDFQIQFKNDLNSFFNNNKFITKNFDYEMFKLEEHDVYKVIVTPSKTPYVTYEEIRKENCPTVKVPKFYVRDGNGTANLNAEDFIKYWIEHKLD